MPNSITFKIPKQTDQSVVDSFIKVQEEVPHSNTLSLRAFPRRQVNESYTYTKDAALDEEFRWYLEQHSPLFERITLCITLNNDFRHMVSLDRKPLSPFDEITIECEAIKGWYPEPKKSEFFIGKIHATCRKHFKASDADASLSGTSDSEWSRYRDSQMGVLNALDNATKTLLVESEKKRVAEEQRLQEKHDQLEKLLREKMEAERKRNIDEHERVSADLAQREIDLQKKVDSFNTKEARYVARGVQKEQIDDLKKWIKDLSLTSESTEYRWPVHIFCVAAILSSGFFAWLFSSQTIGYLTSSLAINMPLLWWQWLTILIKPTIAFATFVSFLVYYIRWSATWAHRLSEEDMRNRVRLLDVGRSQWLLEAIRDSQDHQHELPVELIKELSRNLFANPQCTSVNEADAGAVGKALLQGLSSIRVKSPDGSELEAKNESSKQAK